MDRPKFTTFSFFPEFLLLQINMNFSFDKIKLNFSFDKINLNFFFHKINTLWKQNQHLVKMGKFSQIPSGEIFRVSIVFTDIQSICPRIVKSWPFLCRGFPQQPIGQNLCALTILSQWIWYIYIDNYIIFRQEAHWFSWFLSSCWFYG